MRGPQCFPVDGTLRRWISGIETHSISSLPAFIEFRSDMTGKLGFIAVEGWMDCREAAIGDRPGLEFSRDNNDERDPASGGGWAALQSDRSLRNTSTFIWATTRHLWPSESDRRCLQAGGVRELTRGSQPNTAWTTLPLDDQAESGW